MGLIAMGWSCVVKAGECNLQVPFGPVSFNREQPVVALRKILAGTGISLMESDEQGGVNITANNVAGTVDEAVLRMAEGTGLQYTCRNGVMRVAQPLLAVDSPDSSMPETGNQSSDQKLTFIQIHKGDSLKAQLVNFAQHHRCVVRWEGDDVLAPQDALFSADSVEKVIRKFLLAEKMSAD
jgi:hypothetical protein